MKDRQQNSTNYPIHFLLVQSSDSKTPAVGLTPTVNLCKAGGNFYLASGTISEKGFGWYSVAGNSYDRDTLGELLVHCSGTGADVSDDRYTIVPWNPFDGGKLGLSGLPNIDINANIILSSGQIAAIWGQQVDELTAIPQFPVTYGDMFKWIYERSHNKTQTTGSGDYIFKNDSATILGSGQLFDDGVTFTRLKYI